LRLLIFHGYLLGGTGSNVYNARLAAALVGLGHEVHLLAQERHPERFPFVEAVGGWQGGELVVRPVRSLGGRSELSPGEWQGKERPAGKAQERQERPRCTVYRPEIGSLLPVYVADRYEGMRAKTFTQCSDEEVAQYVAANVAAVADVIELARPEIGLANHLVMGPAILARATRGVGQPGGELPPGGGPAPAGGLRYAVKVHGSALEYTVKREPERFLGYAREGLEEAQTVLVGSEHTARSLWEALGDDGWLAAKTRLGPPGVDVKTFAPRARAHARAGIEKLTVHLQADAVAAEARAAAESETATAGEAATAGDGFAREEAEAGRALGRLDPERDRLVGFVGKLIVSKGVDLLVGAWPLVLAQVPEARLLMVGFGGYRAGLEGLIAALSAGSLDQAREIARAGRALEDGPGGGREGPAGDVPVGAPDVTAAASTGRPLRHLLAFLDSLDGRERESYLAAASGLGERVVLTGRLDHEELVELLPACEALVVPSTFPESFGMVAVEGAACGALPISAGHSGLAEVSRALALGVPEEVGPLLSFPVDDDVVRALAARIVGWLQTDGEVRERTREGLVAVVRERWSWEGVARGVTAAASRRFG
jgi:glycosyltransferase involved in cell wall biosynthesis